MEVVLKNLELVLGRDLGRKSILPFWSDLTQGFLPLSDPLHTFRRSSQGDRLTKISSGGGVAWPEGAVLENFGQFSKKVA